MTQYIDKDRIVAEIKERIDRNNESAASYSSNSEHDYFFRVEEKVYKSLLSFINVLEVKEVDLENSVKGRIDYPLIGVDFPNIYPNYKELKDYCDKNGIKDDDEVKIIIIKDK